MSRGMTVALVLGMVIAAAVAGIVVSTFKPIEQTGKDINVEQTAKGKEITIDLNENLGVKEKS